MPFEKKVLKIQDAVSAYVSSVEAAPKSEIGKAKVALLECVFLGAMYAEPSVSELTYSGWSKLVAKTASFLAETDEGKEVVSRLGKEEYDRRGAVALSSYGPRALGYSSSKTEMESMRVVNDVMYSVLSSFEPHKEAESRTAAVPLLLLAANVFGVEGLGAMSVGKDGQPSEVDGRSIKLMLGICLASYRAMGMRWAAENCVDLGTAPYVKTFALYDEFTAIPETEIDPLIASYMHVTIGKALVDEADAFNAQKNIASIEGMLNSEEESTFDSIKTEAMLKKVKESGIDLTKIRMKDVGSLPEELKDVASRTEARFEACFGVPGGLARLASVVKDRCFTELSGVKSSAFTEK